MCDAGPAFASPCASYRSGTARRERQRVSRPPASRDDDRPLDRRNGALASRTLDTSRRAVPGELRRSHADVSDRAARRSSWEPSVAASGPREACALDRASLAASEGIRAQSTRVASPCSSVRTHIAEELPARVDGRRVLHGMAERRGAQRGCLAQTMCTATQSALTHRRVQPQRQNPHTIRA